MKYFLIILSAMMGVVARADMTPKLGVSPWEERGGDVWEAQITDGRGSLLQLSVMEIPFLNGTRRPVIFFKVSQQCFDVAGEPKKNMATVTWTEGERFGKVTDCEGKEGRSLTPPIIEQAMPSYPLRVRCLVRPRSCRQI